MYILYNGIISISYTVQPVDGHYQAPKHVVIPYVENTLYSINKYSCVRRVHTLYISYLIEYNLMSTIISHFENTPTYNVHFTIKKKCKFVRLFTLVVSEGREI